MTHLVEPEGYADLTPEQREKICNGCGAGNALFDYVPDSIYGMSISDV